MSPATFRAGPGHPVSWDAREALLVAYAPARPEWGAVGAVRRSDIEAQLAGRALPASST
ncbi:hypothetical protein [Streptomyces sp. NPDC048196]|uniref:hypothetical protein n=1 Tax=Streptomyces sp. NPDC048196 TaxID=3154712 RepID=UPI0033EE1692